MIYLRNDITLLLMLQPFKGRDYRFFSITLLCVLHVNRDNVVTMHRATSFFAQHRYYVNHVADFSKNARHLSHVVHHKTPKRDNFVLIDITSALTNQSCQPPKLTIQVVQQWPFFICNKVGTIYILFSLWMSSIWSYDLWNWHVHS